jgi:hypothetical protein
VREGERGREREREREPRDFIVLYSTYRAGQDTVPPPYGKIQCGAVLRRECRQRDEDWIQPDGNGTVKEADPKERRARTSKQVAEENTASILRRRQWRTDDRLQYFPYYHQSFGKPRCYPLPQAKYKCDVNIQKYPNPNVEQIDPPNSPINQSGRQTRLVSPRWKKTSETLFCNVYRQLLSVTA